VAKIAVSEGHTVTAAVRPSSTIDALEHVTVQRGDLTDPDFLGAVFHECEAVISCAGIRRAGLSPFARLLSPPDLCTRLASAVTRAMDTQFVRRLVVISAGGVAESIDQLTWPVRRMVSIGSIAVAYRDLAGMESRLAASSLDWLAVRPVTLVNGPPLGRARAVARYGLTSVVRRADVAAWMVKQATRHDSFTDHMVLLGS
jgi:putative NADH-flavin reductase